MRDRDNEFSEFFGGRPIKVFLKLALISLLVGFLMAMFSLQPLQVVDSAVRFIVGIFETGFAAFGEFGSYIVTGATLVVPIWLVMRVLAARRERKHHTPE